MDVALNSYVCYQEILFQIFCGKKLRVNRKARKDVQHVGRWCMSYFYPKAEKSHILECFMVQKKIMATHCQKRRRYLKFKPILPLCSPKVTVRPTCLSEVDGQTKPNEEVETFV